MSTRTPVEPPSGKSPPDPEPPHGLVEEIREEIGHAVEHVPKPVRWTVRKLVWFTVISMGALLVIAILSLGLYYMHRTELVAKELTLFLNTTLRKRSDIQVEFADIRGNPLRQVRLIRPRVRFVEGGPPLLEAPWIEVGYSPWNLLRGSSRAIDIRIEAPVVTLGRRLDGRLRLPAWRTTETGGKPQALDVTLRVHRGDIRVPAPLEGIHGIELEALASSGPESKAAIRRLSWELGPYHTRALELQGEISSGDSVRFVVRRLRTRDLDLTARGGWRKNDTRKVLHVELAQLRWTWLAEVTENHAFAVPGEGHAVVDAVGDRSWRGRFRSDLVWNQLPVRGEGEFGWLDRKLTVFPLHAASPAGDLDGRVAWSRLGWEVGGDVRRGEPSRWGSIGIAGWPKGDVSGRFRYAVDTRQRQSRGRLDAVMGASELAGWQVDSAGVTVTFPGAGPDSFRVRASRRGGSFELAGTTTPGGWRAEYSASGLPLEEWPDGRASGLRGRLGHAAGGVEGRSGQLLVTGALEGGATDWLGIHAASWRLEGVHGVLLPKPDLSAAARLSDMMFLGLHFDTTSVDLGLGDQTVTLAGLQAQAGDTVVTAGGRADWTPKGWRLELDRAEAKSTRFDWLAEGPLALSGDPKGVSFDRVKAADGPSSLEISGRWAAPGGYYDWRAHGRSLQLGRLGLPDDWQLAGAADVDLQVHGASGEPRWDLDGRLSKPGWQGHSADSLALHLSGKPSTLEIHHGELRLAGGKLTVEGGFDRAHPWPDTLTAEGVQRWLAGAADWHGVVASEELPLSRVRELWPAARGWNGLVSGRLEIRGSPARPLLELNAHARPLAWQTYAAEDFQLRATYRDQRLEVPELRMTRGALVSTVSGAMPLRLALGNRPEVPEAPMAWRLDVPNGDLSLLPLFVPQVGAASGRFDLAASVKGTPKHPDLDGSGHIRDAMLRMAGREEVVKGVRASFTLDESRITLDSLTARQGDRGTVRASGAIELSGVGFKGYRFDVRMRDVTASEPGVYAVQFDGNFTVTNGPRVNGQWLPMVTGQANVRRAAILFDFANQSEVQQLAATSQPLFWLYRIRVVATSNLHWQPPDGDIEFSADLSLEQTPDQLVIYGDMKALRGTYWFLSNRFTVQTADLTFDNVGGTNPVIDAEATTHIAPGPSAASTELQAGTSANEPAHDVTVRIKGRSQEPVIELESKPNDWDEAKILEELTVLRFYDPKQGFQGVTQTLGDPLDNYLTRAINRTLSAEMSRAFRGYVSEWALDRERGGLLNGQGDIIIGVGTQVTPNLLLRYRQRVPGSGRQSPSPQLSTDPFERDIEAEYRLNRFFYVTSELTQRRALAGSATAPATPAFNVNLKARWEY